MMVLVIILPLNPVIWRSPKVISNGEDTLVSRLVHWNQLTSFSCQIKLVRTLKVFVQQSAGQCIFSRKRARLLQKLITLQKNLATDFFWPVEVSSKKCLWLKYQMFQWNLLRRFLLLLARFFLYLADPCKKFRM